MQHGKYHGMENKQTDTENVTFGKLAENLGFEGKYKIDRLRKATGTLGFSVRVAENDTVPDDLLSALTEYYANRKSAAVMGKANGTFYERVINGNRRPTAVTAPVKQLTAVAETEKQNSVAITENRFGNPTRFQVSVALLSVATVVLITASVHSVSVVLEKTFPLGWFSLALSFVICSAPLLVLIPGELTNTRVAIATMVIVFLIEVWANAISINMTATEILLEKVNHVSAFDDVTYSWAFGIGLPTISLLFEILLLDIIKK